MAKKKKNKKVQKAKEVTVSQYANPLSELRLSESYVSLLLGIVVVLVVAVGGIFVIQNIRQRIAHQPQPIQTTVMQKKDSTPSAQSQKTHVVGEGEGLWQVAEAEYGDGNKWIDIAKANNITNPDSVVPGTKLIIPR